MATREECAQLSLTSYHSGDGTIPEGWTQIFYQPPTSTGFSATAYQTTTGEIVIAYAGTQSPGSGFSNDVVSDIQILLDEAPDQYREALAFYTSIKDANSGSTITITGQSLGGSLAQLVGAKTGTTTLSYNSIGIASLLDDCGITNNNFSKITNYSLGNDLANIGNISLGLDQIGTTYIIPSTKVFPIVAHNDFFSLANANTMLEEDWVSNNKLFYDIIKTAGKNVTALLGIDAWKDFSDMFGLDSLNNYAIKSGVHGVTAINNQFKRLMSYGKMTWEYLSNNLDIKNLLFLGNREMELIHLAFRMAMDAYSTPQDPIILDLNGDGIKTTTVANGTYFDYANDEFAESSAWVDSNDGILVTDTNANGIIDNQSELITSLSAYDTNGDGVINSSDSSYNSLKILKGDGTLQTLTEAGIASINTTTTTTGTIDSSGNTQDWSGTYTKLDGTTLTLGDYQLEYLKAA